MQEDFDTFDELNFNIETEYQEENWEYPDIKFNSETIEDIDDTIELDEEEIVKKRKKRTNYIKLMLQRIEEIESIEKLYHSSSYIKFRIQNYQEKFVLTFKNPNFSLEIETDENYHTIKTKKLDSIINFLNNYNEKSLGSLTIIRKFNVSESVDEIEIPKVYEPEVTKEYIKKNKSQLKNITIAGAKHEYYNLYIKSLNYNKKFRRDAFTLDEIVKLRDKLLLQNSVKE